MPPSTEPPVVIDAAGFPHIIDAVLDALRESPTDFLPLALVCRAWRDKVYAHIFSELGITPIDGYSTASASKRGVGYRLTTVTEPTLRFDLTIPTNLPFEVALALVFYESTPEQDNYPLSKSLRASVRILSLHDEVPNEFFDLLPFPNVRIVRCSQVNGELPTREFPTADSTMIIHFGERVANSHSSRHGEPRIPHPVTRRVSVLRSRPAPLRPLAVLTYGLGHIVDPMTIFNHHLPLARERVVILPPSASVSSCVPADIRIYERAANPRWLPGGDFYAIINGYISRALLDWLCRNGKSLASDVDQCHITFVLDLPCTRVPPSTSYADLAVHLKQGMIYRLSKLRNMGDTIDRAFSFLSHAEYRAKVGDETYRLHTLPMCFTSASPKGRHLTGKCKCPPWMYPSE